MKRFSVVFLMVFLHLFIALTAFAQEETPVFKRIGDLEKTVYGEPQPGGLIVRLSSIEKELFGRELPGSVAERQNALFNFVEKGSDSQPSFLFKLSVAEWVTEQFVYPLKPAVTRLRDLEKKLEGQVMAEGPLAMRLERLLSLLVSEPVEWKSTGFKKGSVVRVALSDTISPATSKVGDVVEGTLTRDIVVDNLLIAPKGSAVEGTISKVTKPRSFGRSAEVNFVFDVLKPLSLQDIPLSVGDEAKKAAEAEKAQIAAAGGSLVGAILLGPIGLAGGFFVRGDVKEIPEGTVFHLQGASSTEVMAYPVPAGLVSLLHPEEKVVSADLIESDSEVDNL